MVNMVHLKNGRKQTQGNRKKVVQRKEDVIKQQSKEDEEEERKTRELFAKRKIDTNQAERYKDLRSSESENEEFNETNNYEYIIKHSGDLTAHFKFKEEKEWDDEIGDEEGFFKFNLDGLANNISDLDPCSRFQLYDSENDEDDDSNYCFEHLKPSNQNFLDIYNSPSITAQPIEWNYEGIENINKWRRKCNLTNDIETVEVTSDSHISSLKNNKKDNDIEYITEHNKTRSKSKLHITNSFTTNKTDKDMKRSITGHVAQEADDDLNCLLKTSISVKPKNQGKEQANTEGQIVSNKDHDNRCLFETSVTLKNSPKHSSRTSNSGDQESLNAENSQHDEEIKELDEWLDSILD